MACFRLAVLSTLLFLQTIGLAVSFVIQSHGCQTRFRGRLPPRQQDAFVVKAAISEKDAKVGIDKVVTALRRDNAANRELGKLTKVTCVLGYGSPSKGTLAVRFNASFKKEGMGRSAVPLPFGLGQSKVAEGRGTMVGQVKASIDERTGKVTSCSVFRDLGYGRAFNLKV